MQPQLVADKYELLKTLGSGAMGTVFEARHCLTGARLALKLIHNRSPRPGVTEERFLREVSVASRIGHEGIVQVIDAGRDEATGNLFLAMELLEGETFRVRASRPGCSLGTAFLVIYELLEPLGHAHQAGVIHRDLKPDNVFIELRPEGSERVKLLDFGIAKLVDGNQLTVQETGIGTPYYMAPEQAMDARSVQAQADVWSVGVMMYWLVAGHAPFAGESPYETVLKVCTTEPEALPEVVHERMLALIRSCLSKNAANRPADGFLLRDRLGALLADPEVWTSLARPVPESLGWTKPAEPLPPMPRTSSSAATRRVLSFPPGPAPAETPLGASHASNAADVAPRSDFRSSRNSFRSISELTPGRPWLPWAGMSAALLAGLVGFVAWDRNQPSSPPQSVASAPAVVVAPDSPPPEPLVAPEPVAPQAPAEPPQPPSEVPPLGPKVSKVLPKKKQVVEPPPEPAATEIEVEPPPPPPAPPPPPPPPSVVPPPDAGILPEPKKPPPPVPKPDAGVRPARPVEPEEPDFVTF